MNPGDYIIMTKFPTEDYAVKYCKEAGLCVGCICQYVSVVNSSTVLIESSKSVELGIGFLNLHFRKSLRFSNLDKVLS